MCDAATQTILEAVIDEKVRSNAMFTAFDISREAQKRGVNERHLHLRQDIHIIYVNGGMPGYDRTAVSITGVLVSPFVYHPNGTDANQYLNQNTTVDPISSFTQTPIIPATSQSVFTTIDTSSIQSISNTLQSSDNHNGTDKRGRLWIAGSLIQGIGAVPGDNVYVTFNGTNSLIVTKNIPTSASEAAVYKVDRHSNIAISSSVFTETKLNGKKYVIMGTATEVIIKAI